MTPTESHYFALLRSALWQTPVTIDGPIEWEGVVRLARHHANLALLGDVAAKMTADTRPSDTMLNNMQVAMRNNLLSQLRLKQILVSAVTLLRQHGIDPVLLKGFSLAMLYPNPSLRQFGDIDLFVGLDDFHEACKQLRTLPGGYNWGEEVDVGHQYNIEFGNYPMEIHRVSAEVNSAKGAAIYAAIERDGLLDNRQHVDFEGLEVAIPSKEFMVFFTFYHAWHHFLTTGAGWRQITDIAMTLHAYHGQLDLDKLRQWLSDMNLMLPWQTFGYLMVQQLGLPELEMPFYDVSVRRRAQRLYCNVMEMGNFGRHNRFKQHRPKQKILRKFHSFLAVFYDFFYCARIFPSVAFKEMCNSLSQALDKLKNSDGR